MVGVQSGSTAINLLDPLATVYFMQLCALSKSRGSSPMAAVLALTLDAMSFRVIVVRVVSFYRGHVCFMRRVM